MRVLTPMNPLRYTTVYRGGFVGILVVVITSYSDDAYMRQMPDDTRNSN